MFFDFQFISILNISANFQASVIIISAVIGFLSTGPIILRKTWKFKFSIKLHFD